MDWKPMSQIGRSVREIRIQDADGAFCVFYVANFTNAVYVSHCFRSDRNAPANWISIWQADDSSSWQERIEMDHDRYASVWDAIEDDPAQAENLKLRSQLMIALTEHLSKAGWSQIKAAKQLGVTQPRISDLMRGKIDLFGLDSLVNMLSAAGLRVEMTVKKAA
jgi:predicted XRE-type DNA-binding protein